MELSQEKIKYKRKKSFNSFIGFKSNNLKELILPLPWEIWPYEAKILIIFIGIWSVLGLFILGSSSWWVASKEMGEWTYFLKKQIIWYIPGLCGFYLTLNTNTSQALSRFFFQ